jgi:hypothetical protein
MRAAALVVAGVVLALAVRAAADDAPPTRDDGLRAFSVVYAVLESPRCRNCHPAGDRPLQTDAGIAHAQNISRRSVANGVTCATCHRDRNGARAGQPPGAPHWQLPPAEVPMIFEGRTPHQLCAQLSDPSQTRGRDIPALIEHVDRDPLVQWGWAPGPGRTPVPVPHDRFVAAMRAWFAAGAPCPEP